ncbi:hypothetical protein BH09BAC4_BH09BAC4_00270 [soil metagenome]
MKTAFSYGLAFLLFWYVGIGFAQEIFIERTPAGKPGGPLVTSEFCLTSGQTFRINPYGSRSQTRGIAYYEPDGLTRPGG